MKVKVLVTHSCLTLCDPMDCSPSGSSVHGISQARILEYVAIIFPNQGLNPHLLQYRWILYQLKPQGKPKNTGVGSLSLLQGIFPTHRSNSGLPYGI